MTNMTLKGHNTINGQCIWICGYIENLDRKMIRLYLGCDACGSKTYEDIETKYKCSKSSCTSRMSTSVARFVDYIYSLSKLSLSMKCSLQ